MNIGRVFGRYALLTLAFLAVAWALHTASGVTYVGVENLRFTRHKMEEGFSPWQNWKLLLIAHALSAALAVLTGAFGLLTQSLPAWRLHRLLGYLYFFSVSFSATTGLPLAMTATGGLVATAGFLVLDFLWVANTAIGIRAARSRQIGMHAKWLIRSYSLTLANTTLHLALPALTASLGDRTDAYRTAIWLALIVNLAIAEMLIRRTHLLFGARHRNGN